MIASYETGMKPEMLRAIGAVNIAKTRYDLYLEDVEAVLFAGTWHQVVKGSLRTYAAGDFGVSAPMAGPPGMESAPEDLDWDFAVVHSVERRCFIFEDGDDGEDGRVTFGFLDQIQGFKTSDLD